MKRKLLLNTISPLTLQFVTVISGLIVPRLILGHYGSNVNGLVQSIAQFLLIITFFEAGVGSVVRFNLYKPFFEKNFQQISRVFVAAKKFFRTVAYIFLGYTILLLIIYPTVIVNQFGYLYTAVLIIVMFIILIIGFIMLLAIESGWI